MCLKVSDENVELLVDDHREELTTAELQNIHIELQHVVDEEIASDEDKETWERVSF